MTNIATRSRAIVDPTKTIADHSTSEMGSIKISDDVQTLVIKTINDEITNLSESLTSSFTENEELRNKIESLENRLKLTEGLLTQAQTKIKMQDEKILDLQSRSMRDNIVIRGIGEDENESWDTTRNKVVDFMKTELKIHNADKSMIDRAHRIGMKTPEATKPRSIVAKFTSSDAKSAVYKNVKNLAGKNNFSIQEQLPAEIQERRNRLWPMFKEAKTKYKDDKKTKVSWSYDKLKIGNKLHSRPDDFQNVNPASHNKPTAVVHAKQITDEGSIFQGHASRLSNNISVSDVLANLLRDHRIAKAHHNIYAFRTGQGPTLKESCNDDGEHGAGNKLLEMLREKNCTDTIVVCTRWYGGTHIGPKRFTHIKNSAQSALDKLPSK